VSSQLRLRQPRLGATVIRLLGLADCHPTRAQVGCVVRGGRHEALIRSRAASTDDRLADTDMPLT
jgi:hypothetical protein